MYQQIKKWQKMLNPCDKIHESANNSSYAEVSDTALANWFTSTVGCLANDHKNCLSRWIILYNKQQWGQC